MNSILVEEVKEYELLKFGEKNSLVGPLVSNNELVGAIIIALKRVFQELLDLQRKISDYLIALLKR